MVEISDKEKIVNKDDIKEIMKNIEANIVGCFWHNPYLFFDYNDLNMDSFKNPIWLFFFTIGKKMAIKNIKKLDEVAVELFLINNENLAHVYEKYGGYEIIKNLELYSTVENVDAYINELKKWNTVYDMIDKLTFTEDYIKKIKNMNVEEVYGFYNAQMNNIFINVNDDVEIDKLENGLDEVISIADKGLNKGMPIDSPMLSNEIGGWMNGQITLLGGLSGTGKTSMTQEIVLSKIWELDESVVIALNEQDSFKWKQQMITWIINNKLKVKGDILFNSKRWRDGHFTISEKEYLFKATGMLKAKIQDNKIIFAHFKSYSQKRVERIIRKYASLGIKKFIIDTFKNTDIPVVLVLNKIDKLNDDGIINAIRQYKDLYHFSEIIPISAMNNDNIDRLIKLIKSYLTDTIIYYDDGTITNTNIEFMVAELVREKILNLTNEEVPHSITCATSYYKDKGSLVEIYVDIIIDRDSLKKIIIGKQGAMLKNIGILARKDIESLLGKQVYLQLFVKTIKKWRDKERYLKELGFKENE